MRRLIEKAFYAATRWMPVREGWMWKIRYNS